VRKGVSEHNPPSASITVQMTGNGAASRFTVDYRSPFHFIDFLVLIVPVAYRFTHFGGNQVRALSKGRAGFFGSSFLSIPPDRPVPRYMR
jgi:hypothetical protein